MRLRHAPRPEPCTEAEDRAAEARAEPKLQLHFRRIDDPHPSPADRQPADRQPAAQIPAEHSHAASAPAVQPADSAAPRASVGRCEIPPDVTSASDSEAETWRQSLLRLHAEDLVARLQDWADDVDAREAWLNARVAMHERSERTFRMKQQSFQAEMAERQHQVERLRERIEAHARRIAFADHDVK